MSTPDFPALPEPPALTAFRRSFSRGRRFRQRAGAAIGLLRGLVGTFLRNSRAGRELFRYALAVHRSGLFDRDYYCWAYPAVVARRFSSPLLDYCRNGIRMRRAPDPVLDAALKSDREPPSRDPLLAHAERFGRRKPDAESVWQLVPSLHPARTAQEEAQAAVRNARAEAVPKPPLAVVVPVHGHPELLPPLAASLLEHTPPDVLLLFVDDASPDPRVRPALLRLAAAWPGRVRVECLDGNAGFAGACNHGIRAAGRRDVILLNSDVVVSPRWSDTLRLAVYGGERIGSATAVSNNSGAVSVPEPGFNPMPAGTTVAQTARGWLHGPDLVFDWHTGHGFCLYLRRDMLDDVGLFDTETFGKGYGEENDLCLRAWRRGWAHRIVPRAFVWHLNAASFGSGEKRERVRRAGLLLRARYPELDALQTANFRGWERQRPRFRLLARTLAAGVRPKPRVLFVISGVISGGTLFTTLDLAGAARDGMEAYLLRCDDLKMELFRIAGGKLVGIAARTLPDFPPLGSHELAAFDDILVGWVLSLGIELVHVRHLIRGSSGYFSRLRALHIPVVFSCHDYYAATPAYKLLDGEGKFRPDGVADGKTPFTEWVRGAPEKAVRLDPGFCEAWKRRFGERIAPFCSAFVTTSEDAKKRLQSLLPVLRDRDADFRVIPHGRDFASFGSLAVPPVENGPVRILVPGIFAPYKGSDLVRAMAAEDGGRTVEFHVLGRVPEDTPAVPGLVFHGPYERNAFPARVREIRPAFALVPSPWPETWCHTLTECWSVGLPVAAFDLGAPGERLRGECPGGGWLLPPDAAPGEILGRLRSAAADAAGFERAVEAVRAWQNGTGARNGNRRMAARYLDLYASLLDHSATGAAPDAPAPFAEEKTRDETPADPAALDRTDLSAAGTLRLSGFPLPRTEDARLRLLARLCGTRIALVFPPGPYAFWRDAPVAHHALLAAADEVRKPNRPPLDAEGFPVLRPTQFVPLPAWLQEKRNAAWAAAKAARAGRPAATVVYTAITGSYDPLQLPEAPEADVDYVCFCDTPPPEPHGPWELRPLAWKGSEDPVRNARWHKLHGPGLFPGAEVVVWCDANLLLRDGVVGAIREKLLDGPNPLATLRHFDRDNVYGEVEACIFRGKDDPALLRAQVARYRAAGLPDRHPFAETSILAFRPADPRVRAMFAAWWDELAAGSRRDQISFPFAMWKNGLDFTPLFDRDIRLAGDRVHFNSHVRSAPAAPCTHARQFVLSRRRFERPGFRHLDLPDGSVLSFHPDLRVRATPDRRTVLLGLAWSCAPDVPDPLAAAAACQSDGELERVLDAWSGRWILLRDGRLRMDASGLLGVFYRNTDCSSSLALLGEHLGFRPRRPGLQHQFGGMDFYPGPLTPQPGVFRLLPCQGFDFAAGTPFERPPEPPAPPFASDAERIAAVTGAFDVLLRRIAADYPGRVRLPLTAGYDSRTLAALLHHAGVDFGTFTMDHRRLRAGDRELPPRLSALLGRPHRFVPRPAQPDEARFRAYDAHCAGLAVDEDRNFYAFRQYPEPGEPSCRVAVLRGGVWESVREYYREKHKLFRTASDLSEFTSAFLNVRFRPDLQRAFAAWLDHCRSVPSPLDPVDRYYLEQRGGAWLSSVEQSLDIIPGMDSIQPCNCRRILSILRSFAREDRIACRHQAAVIRAACPALLDLPFQGDGRFLHGDPNARPAGFSARLARKRRTLSTFLHCLGLRGTLRFLLAGRK
jgi:GT2 family glycosyltransferase